MGALHKCVGGRDRLSDLPDDILGHILSFLPTTEAGRAAVLSTRWRYMFANVHTLVFQDTKPYNSWGDAETYYYEAEERRSINGWFIDRVNAALLCRRRCVGLSRNASLRAFRVAFNYYYHWDNDMVQKWVASALQQSCGDEFHLDLRLHVHRLCERGGAPPPGEDDMDYTDYDDEGYSNAGWSLRFPRKLFTCAALRSLRVSHCQLNPPAAIALPSHETLHLTAVGDSWETIHRLIASCPRLDDLMLNSCSQLTRVSVLDRRLHWFSFRCCHDVGTVTLDALELHVLDYRGAVPAESLFRFHGSPPRIRSGTIAFCGRSLSSEAELAAFQKFLSHFTAAEHLHLQSRRLGCSIESEFFTGFPSFPSLRKLELAGSLDRQATAGAVPRILQQTPNLEVLTLFLTPVTKENSNAPFKYDYDIATGRFAPVAKESSNAPIEYNLATVPDAATVPCLRQRLREINLVQYQDSDEQRMLAKLLLGNALVLQDLCVVFPNPSRGPQTTILMNEIKQMVVSKWPKITFL